MPDFDTAESLLCIYPPFVYISGQDDVTIPETMEITIQHGDTFKQQWEEEKNNTWCSNHEMLTKHTMHGHKERQTGNKQQKTII